MKSSLKNAALVALFTLGLASVAQAANIPAQSRNHMLTASASVIGPSDAQYGVRNLQPAVPAQSRNHMLTAEIPAQLRDRMLTASANIIGPSDAQYGVRNLQAALPSQVVDHILAASASPEANGYYTGLIQQA